MQDNQKRTMLVEIDEDDAKAVLTAATLLEHRARRVGRTTRKRHRKRARRLRALVERWRDGAK
jgi:hypothetical protein